MCVKPIVHVTCARAQGAEKNVESGTQVEDRETKRVTDGCIVIASLPHSDCMLARFSVNMFFCVTDGAENPWRRKP